MRTLKVSSTPDDYSRAILTAVREIRDVFGIAPGEIDAVVHATTVATNTILEHKGAKTALITTEGFRDVLEMRRLRIPVMYDLQYDKPAPLVPRRLRYEPPERMGPRGEVKKPLDEEQVRVAAKRLLEEGVESVSDLPAPLLCQRGARAARGRAGARTIEWQRLHQPVVGHPARDPRVRAHQYRGGERVHRADRAPLCFVAVGAAERRRRHGPLHIMQSNGGTMSAAAAAQKPAFLVESGPAAGVIACADIARSAGLGNVISFDMGARPQRPQSSRTASRRAPPNTKSAPASTSARSSSRAAATRSSCRSSTFPRSARAAAVSSRSTPPARSRSGRKARAPCRDRRATGWAARKPRLPTLRSCSAISIPTT